MDSEDDICVLQHSDDDIEVDTGSHPVIPFSPFSQATSCGADSGSHFALKKAYLTLKEKLNDTNIKNQQLVRRIQELESSSKNRDLDSFVNIGESFDMMEDARYVAEGRMGLQPPRGAVVGAGESNFASNLRQPMVEVPLPQSEGVETRFGQYKEKTPENNQALSSLNQQVALLRQENLRLQQGWEAERKEKEVALQELREKCCSLQSERDKALKEGTSLLTSLQKANQELAILKERQGDSVVSEPPPELLNEMIHMRQVIDKLKTMVLMQKDCLVNRSMSMSRTSLNPSPHDVPSMESHSSPQASSGGSHSGQSWEMVNGVVTAPTNARQQLLQQRSAKIVCGDLPSPRRGNTSVNPPASRGGNAGKPVAANNQNGQPLNSQNGLALNNQSRPAHGSPRQGQQSGLPQKSSTEVIHRRHSEVDVHQPMVKTGEAPRAHTLPQQTPRLAEWMGNHYQQQPLPQGTKGVMVAPAGVGLNQFMKDAPRPNPAAGIVVSGQVVSSPPRPGQVTEVQFPPAPAHYPPRQPSPHSQPNSTYDNIALASSTTSASTNGTIVPSMHILNQSSMTGARVLQNSSGGFSNGGITTVTSDPPPPVLVGVNRDGAGLRGPPQEHSDNLTRPHNPTDLELTPEIHFANELPGGQNETNLDRKCPVCSQDFGHIPMDEFQTHVFECFDDADDTSNAPETLQPQQGPVGLRAGCNDRVCPMCEQSFALTVSQDYFETHVQSHFEDVVNHFEVLDVHRT